MNPRILFLPAVLTAAGTASARHIQTPPNIVVILADDLGFPIRDASGARSKRPYWIGWRPKACGSHNSTIRVAAAPREPAF